MTARQACGVDFPFVTATSICLSTVTICSGLYLSIGILYALLHEILSHFGCYKYPRLGHLLQSISSFFHAPKTITKQKQARPQGGLSVPEKALAAGAIVSLRPALSTLDDLPDTVQTLLNNAAISL